MSSDPHAVTVYTQYAFSISLLSSVYKQTQFLLHHDKQRVNLFNLRKLEITVRADQDPIGCRRLEPDPNPRVTKFTNY
jgi:hypothetical protein